MRRFITLSIAPSCRFCSTLLYHKFGTGFAHLHGIIAVTERILTVDTVVAANIGVREAQRRYESVSMHELVWRVQRNGTAYKLVMRSSGAGPFAELKYPTENSKLALLSAGSRRYIIRNVGYGNPEIEIGSNDLRFDGSRLTLNKGDEAATLSLPDGRKFFWRSGSIGLCERMWTFGVQDVLLRTRNVGRPLSPVQELQGGTAVHWSGVFREHW